MSPASRPPRPVISAPYAAVIPFPLLRTPGGLGIRVTARGLAAIDYLRQPAFLAPTGPLARRVVEQLERYFADGSFRFDLPLDTGGTPFQRRTWRALTRITPGSTARYGELAQQLDSAAQAIGQACRRNPIPVIVPCHRVVSRHGLGGYSGEVEGLNLQIKRALLGHEGVEGVEDV